MRTSLLAWWAAACLVRGAAAGALIVQAPDFGGGVNKTLVIVGGASIANDKYAPLGRAIQRFAAANNLSLWVAIPAFPLDTPNPAALPAEVEEAYAATFDGCAPEDVFVAGHSLGGIFSQALVHGSSYAGLVLLGSYLSTVYGYDVASFPKPVLTLGGELDGLTRVTRLARELASLEAAVGAGGERAKFDKPVGLALGVSHSQFASGVNVTSFGVKDLRPAVTEGAAHAAIGEIVAAFLAFQTFGTAARPDALVALAVAVDELNATLAPFRAADDAGRCAAWQRSLAANVSAAFAVDEDDAASLAGFDLANPDIAGAAVRVVSRAAAPPNPADSSLARVAPSSVDCKALPRPANAKRLAAARALLEGTRALDRYDATGVPFGAFSDRTVATGLGWQAAALDVAAADGAVATSAPLLATADAALCKLLPVSRVVEIALVDGLPRFDGSFAL
ncbi:hypothetical protein SO694_00005045 [Aureococcus anophagefferens]|uniref:Alpha/beta hydrolase fold-5 domain-containing protein n=1 Tax=Aureococcus anophagefferens TaxID=44056 RepID=A0ABR1G977_AURAN